MGTQLGGWFGIYFTLIHVPVFFSLLRWCDAKGTGLVFSGTPTEAPRQDSWWAYWMVTERSIPVLATALELLIHYKN